MKGREAKEGDTLRATPLNYIRLKVYGHKQGTGYRRLQMLCGNKLMEVFGIFCKFLEIAGDLKSADRGKLLNENDKPATIDDLSFMIGASEKQIKNAVIQLCKANWLQDDNLTKLNLTKYNISKGAGNAPTLPEVSGKQHLRVYNKDFMKFWVIYPNKVGKGVAYDSFVKINPANSLLEKMAAAVEQQCKSDRWQADNGKYIPNPSTWLNQGRWEDEVKETVNETTAALRRLKEQGVT